MDKLSRQKFFDIQTGDEIWYVDEQGARCTAEIVGWKNHEGLPAPLVGEHGETAIPLAMIISRSRNGSTKVFTDDR